MHTQHALFAHIIQAIGERNFPAVIAESVRKYVAFELVAVISHGRNNRPALMFDNFDTVGARSGVQNYIRVTHAVNPILGYAMRHRGVLRARDFAIRTPEVDANLSPYLVKSSDEELGFRTLGWPERQEEIGLYFETSDGLIELGLYRRRAQRTLDGHTLGRLAELCSPLAAAFDKHAAVMPRVPPGTSRLSPRENAITQLLLRGCGTMDIALRLGISRYTVKDHRKQIFRKLEVRTLAQLFAVCGVVSR
jgi:DNA-binding CsgD family transcriptional regulator